MTTDYSIRPEAQEVSPNCRHCYGGGWVLEQVETTFGEFEDVSYICFMCRGTGKAMTKEERKAGRR
jgi:DnaJ-class molecular chaperone